MIIQPVMFVSSSRRRMPPTTAKMKERKREERRGKDKDRVKGGFVEERGAGTVEGERQVGAPKGGEGFKRWMTSVGRSVGGCRGEIAPRSLVAINTSPPRLAFATTYLSRCERAKLGSSSLSFSLRHEKEGARKRIESSGRSTPITLDLDGSEL